MQYVYRKAQDGAILVFAADETGEIVATFSNNIKGRIGFELFRIGLSRQVGAALLNADTGQYDIGDVGQLIKE